MVVSIRKYPLTVKYFKGKIMLYSVFARLKLPLDESYRYKDQMHARIQMGGRGFTRLFTGSRRNTIENGIFLVARWWPA